ncbi:MAG: diguanylate cyclase [Desulfovibrio sp.]|jgi:diguanylate cyclase (GGDEF)-like protein|nr:diguanylate cyclase [Desulfovibrio sp.]
MFTRLQNAIAAHPLRSLLLLAALAVPLAGAAAFIHADRERQQHLDTSLAAAQEALRADTEQVAEKAAYRFSMLHDLTELLASAPQWPDFIAHPEKAAQANARVVEYTRKLHLHRAMLINAQGICVASNDFQSPVNLIGVNLGDREYVSEGLKGNTTTQFVVGRVSTVPGFHFSAPVRAGGKVVGVLALKLGLSTLTEQISLYSGFVTDSMGVVVLADDPRLILAAIPGSRALQLDKKASLSRYQRESLQSVPLLPHSIGGRPAYLYGPDREPSLVHVARLPKEDLVVYGVQGIPRLLAEAEQTYRLHLAFTFVGVFMALLLLGGSAVYFLRDSVQRRRLAELNRELQDLAERDHLTGCFNRRVFDHMLEKEILRSERSGAPFSLAFFDLDSFKEVNDTYGHAFGDAMLQRVAATFQGELRRVDIFARLGGDEFAVLMPGATEAAAAEIMARILPKFQSQSPQPEDDQHRQGLSIGVAGWRPGLPSLQLLRNADTALYAAKHCGKDRVVVFSSLDCGPEGLRGASGEPPAT